MARIPGFEGIYTLIKALENLPYEKQEEFLKSQKMDNEGDVVVVRKDNGRLGLGVIEKSGPPENVPPATDKRHEGGEDFKDDSQDSIPDTDGEMEGAAGTGDAGKSKGEDEDLEKGGKHKDSQTQERAEWARDPEGEKKEHGKKSFMEDLSDLNKSFDEYWLGDEGSDEEVEKGAQATSKKVSGGKATQVHYGTKPETRWSHPKGGEEKRYKFEPSKGEVTVRSRKKGEKEFKEGKPVGVTEEKKLKEASLKVAIDQLLEKAMPKVKEATDAQ